MKKIIIASVACFALATFAGCMGKGIGKGKGKAPVAQPVYEEPAYVTKG
ncbi:ABC transporter [Aurantimonas sp. VKM B-3413]|nr:ABC transporter [Aurantimonas sp. VKM B-3413]MCB8837770.1 ABC transporter [Aurantimonas sp. VKM B-3413]